VTGEAFESRRQELTESRRALRQTREEVFLNSTPDGDVGVAYLEGEDPVGDLHGDAGVQGEAGRDRDHDGCCRGDDPGRRRQAVRDGRPRNRSRPD
jgi:hypothetical protein